MTNLPEDLLVEVFREAHRYAPGVEQHRPTRVARSVSIPRRLGALGIERARDVVERAAGRAGFARRHFDPGVAAARLARVMALADGLEATRARLADHPSRRALLNVLKLRVLGPYHAPLRITPTSYRARQAAADRELLVQRGTYDVSDPWFSPLSLYRVPVDGGSPVMLHSHSVDIVSVFLLNQYTYARDGRRVGVEAGDVVIDAGGCWGDTALYFANLVGPHGKVYTFEFDPESLAVLRTNLALNPELASRIEVVEQALWKRSGERLGVIQAGRMTHVVEDAELRELTVPTVSLDDFVEQAGIDRVDFVKVDVEGVEASVLQGGRRVVQRFAPRLAVAAYHNDDDLATLPELVDSLGAGYGFYLDTFSPVEEETVLFATSRR